MLEFTVITLYTGSKPVLVILKVVAECAKCWPA